MLALSRKSDYGLLLLSLLAKNLPAHSAGGQGKKQEFVSLAKIAHQSGLPYPFISRIAAELARAGFLKSREGSAGGYKLVRKPSKISLAQIIEVLDGELWLTRCGQGRNACPYYDFCPMANDRQTGLKTKIWNILKSYTLKDLIK